MTWYSSLLFIAVTASAQTLTGVVDIHVHSDPDSVPRSIDAIDAAKLARTRGMRALLLKNHYESTASLAYLVRKEVPGIELYGGIALNRTVGGVNPAAVERMTLVKGGWGRVVWMPTFDAENQVRFSKEQRPFVSVSKNGQLLPEVKQYIALIGPNKSFAMGDYARAIRELGPKSCILSSDLGQAGNPLHPDGLQAFFDGLAKEGVTQAEIDLMAKTNPARALGLP